MRSIEQFRSVLHHIKKISTFVGFKNDKPVYDETRPLPIIMATGTVKLNGTNCSICSKDNILWTQSKNNIITPTNDNVGFSLFAYTHREFFKNLFIEIRKFYDLNTNDTIAIFGEWVGKGIQSNIAINNIEKSMFIFDIKVVPEDQNLTPYWANMISINDYSNIYDINKFKKFHIEIDFNNPIQSAKKMRDMVLEVERECPVAKKFGHCGIGEGIVFKFNFKDAHFIFKMKSDKHVGKKKKRKIFVDTEREKFLLKIANKVTPEWRLSQMCDESFDIINGGLIDIKGIGKFIKAVNLDIIKEDLDIISDAGIEIYDINRYITNISKKWFFETIKEF